MGLEAVIIGSIISAAATGTASAIAAGSQKGTSKRAAAVEMDAIDKQLAFEREKEAERKAEWDRAQEEAKAQWEASQAEETRRYDLEYGVREAEFKLAKQKYLDRQAQMAPYRQVGVGALSQLAAKTGLPAPTLAAPPVLETMPENWQPGDPVVETPKTTTASTTTEQGPAEEAPVLPVSLGQAPAVETPMTKVKPSMSTPEMSAAAYQGLAAPMPEAQAALTPAQVAMLVKSKRSPTLASLALSRKAV